MCEENTFVFSVVLYLNNEIEKPIENIINQINFHEVQLIILTKKCINKCLNYEANYKNILYLYDIDEKDVLKIGYDNSKAEYLFFMNCNDYLELDVFSTVKKFIDNNGKFNLIAVNYISNNSMEYQIEQDFIINIDSYKPNYLYFNSFFFKKEIISTELYKNNIWFLINCLFNVDQIPLINSTLIFSKNKSTIDLISNIKCIFDILKEYSSLTMPRFLQYLLFEYFIILLDNHINDEITFFIDTILQYIDDDIILSRDFNNFYKKELLRFKPNNSLIEEKKENEYILKYNECVIDKLNNNELFITYLDIINDKLTVEGYFSSCFTNENIIIEYYTDDSNEQIETTLLYYSIFNNAYGISFKFKYNLNEDENIISFRIKYGENVFTPNLNYKYIDNNQKDIFDFYSLNVSKNQLQVKLLKKNLLIDCENISDEDEINNDVFTLWVSDDDYLPELSYLALKSMLLVGHNVTLYTYKSLKNIPEGVNIVDANTILDSSKIFKYKSGHKTYSGFANLFRLKRLYEYGGIWLDLDIILIRNINDLVPDKISICSEPHREFFFFNNNAFLKFPKHDPCIKYMLDYAEKRGDDVYHGETGPKLVQKVLSDNFIEYNKYLKSPNVNNFFGWWDINKFFEDTDYLINNFDFSEIIGFHLTNTFFTKLDLEKYPPKGFYKDLKEIILESNSKKEYIGKLKQLKILNNNSLNRIPFFNSNYLNSIDSKKFVYSFLIDSKYLHKNELYKLIDSISRNCLKGYEIIVLDKTNIVKEYLPKNLNIIFLNSSFKKIKDKLINYINGEIVVPINKPLVFKENFFNDLDDVNYFEVIDITFSGINKVNNLKFYAKNVFKLICENSGNIFDLSKIHLINYDFKIKEVQSQFVFSLETRISNREKEIIKIIDSIYDCNESDFNQIKNDILNMYSNDLSLKLSYFYYNSCINIINSSNLHEFKLKEYIDDLENCIFELLRNK